MMRSFGLDNSRYDPFTRFLFILGGGVGIVVSYYFSVRGFGTQIPDMVWAARGIVIFFIALQVYANRNLAAAKKNWALMLSALASYGYGIWTNIVGVLAFGGYFIRDISLDNWYLLIIPVMVGLPLEIAPEALIIMGFFPESQTVISDGVSGIFSVFKTIFGDIGRASSRPTVDELRTPVTPHPAPTYRPPVSPLNTIRSPLNNLPRSPQAPRYHSLGNFNNDQSDEDND